MSNLRTTGLRLSIRDLNTMAFIEIITKKKIINAQIYIQKNIVILKKIRQF